MAVEMKPNLLTYAEAAQELGVNATYIPNLVSRGKLKAIKVPGDKRKYIDRRDIESYRRGSLTVSVPAAETQSSFFPTSPVSTREVLELVNEGFSKISGDYKDTVTPVLQHIVTSSEEAILAQVSDMIKIFMRNALVMLKQAKQSEITLEDFMRGMFQGLNIPDEVQEKITRFMPELLQETEDKP